MLRYIYISRNIKFLVSEITIDLENIIGGEANAGNGWKMLMECLAVGRGVSLPASSNGASKVATYGIGKYIKHRKQFKIPIGEIINNPALIRKNINEFISYFNKEFNSVGIELPKIKKPKEQKGSGIIDTAVSGIAKGAVSSYVSQIEKNISMGKKTGRKNS